MSNSTISGITVKNQKINQYDSQTVIDGGITLKTKILYGGWQYISNGGHAISTIISSGGGQSIRFGGDAYDTKIQNGGEQYVSGAVYNTQINSGGVQTISGGGGFAKYTTINEYASQYVYGRADNTTINSNGVQYLYGSGNNTTIKKGGIQFVGWDDLSNKVNVKSGGKIILSRGIVESIKVSSGGILITSDCAYINNITTQKGAKITMGGSSAYISGTSNIFTDTKISAGYNFKLFVKNGSEIIFNNNVKAATTTLDHDNEYNNSKLTITGTGNQLYYIQSRQRLLTYDISKLAEGNSTIMLKVISDDKPIYKNITINVSAKQSLGTYKLSKNIDNTKVFAQIYSKNSNLGYIVANGTKLNKNGVTYSLTYSKSATNLKLSAYGNEVWKGTTGADKHTGTVHSDIFYGGKGNDTLTGQNGRDVAVYDKKAWGKDTIAKTSGTMTLLFKDLTASDIVQKLSGTTMTITRASDANQKITVKNWSDSTHNIVFGSSMTKFNAFLKAGTTPSSDVTKAAQKEVWQKAGLASA